MRRTKSICGVVPRGTFSASLPLIAHPTKQGSRNPWRKKHAAPHEINQTRATQFSLSLISASNFPPWLSTGVPRSSRRVSPATSKSCVSSSQLLPCITDRQTTSPRSPSASTQSRRSATTSPPWCGPSSCAREESFRAPTCSKFWPSPSADRSSTRPAGKFSSPSAASLISSMASSPSPGTSHPERPDFSLKFPPGTVHTMPPPASREESPAAPVAAHELVADAPTPAAGPAEFPMEGYGAMLAARHKVVPISAHRPLESRKPAPAAARGEWPIASGGTIPPPSPGEGLFSRLNHVERTADVRPDPNPAPASDPVPPPVTSALGHLASTLAHLSTIEPNPTPAAFAPPPKSRNPGRGQGYELPRRAHRTRVPLQRPRTVPRHRRLRQRPPQNSPAHKYFFTKISIPIPKLPKVSARDCRQPDFCRPG